MNPTHDVARGPVVKIEMPADGGPLNLDDNAVMDFFVHEAVSVYEESGHMRTPYSFKTCKLARKHVLNVIHGRMELPIFKYHGYAEAYAAVCEEVLKVLVVKGCIKHPDPTPQDQDAYKGVSSGHVAEYDHVAAVQDSSQALSAEWPSRLFRHATVPESERPLQFSNREAAKQYVLNAVGAKYSLPLLNSSKVKEMWNSMCATTLELLKKDQQITYPTKKQRRAQAEVNNAQAHEQDEAADKETGVAETSHSSSQNEGTQHVHSAAWQAAYQQGRADGMAEALQMLLSNATLNIHHESAQRTLNTLSGQIAGAENTVTQVPVEGMKDHALDHVKPRECSNTGQPMSTVNPFVASMGSHSNVTFPPANTPKSASKRRLSDPGECGTSKKARGDEI
ncbi:hypothetical protein HDK90DRAFT_494066 [Phyllosticta capitalensis]|uniref:Uncharacterized protein n=1 Tax=Phyllosticta capitalensis TaxID=121624 RepID=A0ABR1YDN1_9PEZI